MHLERAGCEGLPVMVLALLDRAVCNLAPNTCHSKPTRDQKRDRPCRLDANIYRFAVGLDQVTEQI